mmetsp:Transcript_30214/g.83099  ORF Transcript_30214/g.83099 Transcript_30214/m.83099 type:complete len:286 (-) Transcript_30214:73-930(-)
MAEPAPVSALPSSIGVVGCGTIAVATVRGLCSEGGPKPTPQIIVSPRNAAKAAALAAEFPTFVRVASSNQEVVDESKCVIVAVLPKQAEEVYSALKFRSDQQVVNLVATVRLARLRELSAPATDCATCVPLPAVARRQGATLGNPSALYAEAIYKPLGGYIGVEDEAQFKRLQTITTMMGDFYKRQLTAQGWLVSHGVDPSQAAAWVGAAYSTFSADSAQAGPETFKHLVDEQTPGGLNEQVWKEQEADAVYEAVVCSLESAHHRLTTGQRDPDLAPAVKRAKAA